MLLNVTIRVDTIYSEIKGKAPSRKWLGAFLWGLYMKTIKCDLPFAEQIEIHPLSDLHIGDSLSDFKLIMERIEHIRNTPMEQLRQCVKIFEPIKDKILAVLPGNHENRVYKSDGLDITEIMCSQLGIPEKYSPTTALLFIRFGKRSAHHHNRPQLYTAYVTHGSGGGRKEGGKINRLADLASIVDADIYIH